ncbi:hybrid sensor histidine kinase/response regulator [Dyadobacter arcticus]|uniref:histidine kinase n=1 Tax=Dyadobacter arcticus TaxID=1078754 RepID=A0ABX0USC8_9BACT|nr:ATP-binding protein [Dyadobacter arcticus]NIJ55876.1 signal transduction histidine kinase/CheY-like chemotaxis protein/HPt (histidine-containing phosphotransfer) domain-containing protein [Dyadobacter arcticus]
MPTFRDPSFLKSVKGKVLLGFFITTLALGASWAISKLAFNEMLTKLDVLSTPNDKLRLVNKIFKNILQLDQLQNSRTVKGEEQNDQVLAQSAQLIASLDSLSDLSVDDELQLIRIDSMKTILKEREKIYGNYVKVRSKLVNNKDLEDEVKSISGLITTNKLKPDSTVVKTEKRTTTTTVYTELPDSSQKATVKKGFFNRVFKNSKKEKIAPVEPSKVVQKQEVNIQVDTITVAQEDSTIEKVGEAVHAIEKSQKIRTTSFVDREQELAIAGNSLVTQLLDVMQEVEGQVLKQSAEDSDAAKISAKQNVEKLEWVMLGFFFLTALLAYFISTDITRSNRYRSELEDAKEEAEYHSMAKQRFLSNMSHEIRTPLQSIIGYTEALKKDEKPKKQDLETLHSASEHLLYLVNEVLDYSRIISDRFTFEDRVFAINPLLNEVIQVLRPTAISKGLILRLENSLPANLYLNGDPFRLRQVLYNLLTNSIKFTDNGEVFLKVFGVDFGNEIQIEYHISDTGIGLSPDQIQRIFKQFEQADSSISRRYGGTGLGLSIVKALVEGMNGTIKVKSLPGQGTTFAVTTSMEKAETPEIAEETLERSYNITGKVWLVDDDAFILKWCSSVLQMNGIPHTSFSSAEEVLSRPWDDQVKFVLTDMRMSGMNGAEMCNRLRKSVPEDTKFFVLTAQALPEERDNLLDMGFDGYLMKPFHSKELLELLESSSVPLIETLSPPEEEIDFTTLNEMTFGDESLLKEILDQFVKDSRKDINALQYHIKNHELNAVEELMHRMAGRTGQIGAKELSARFRHYEIALRETPAQVSLEEMKNVIENARLIIEQVQERALAYSM